MRDDRMNFLKEILILSRPYWGRIALAGVCSIIISGLNGSLAWLAKPAVDKVFVEKNGEALLLISAAILAAYLCRGVFSFIQSYLMRSAGAKIVRDIRNNLYHHATGLPMSFFGKDSTGAMISRIINDAGAFQGLLAFTIKDLFVESCTIVVLIGVAMYMRWDLTLIAIIILP
ncbi:MAG: ABC transporter permease, partial [Nitrospirae bacterium]